jgi:hypothetical protein
MVPFCVLVNSFQPVRYLKVSYLIVLRYSSWNLNYQYRLIVRIFQFLSIYNISHIEYVPLSAGQFTVDIVKPGRRYKFFQTMNKHLSAPGNRCRGRHLPYSGIYLDMARMRASSVFFSNSNMLFFYRV